MHEAENRPAAASQDRYAARTGRERRLHREAFHSLGEAPVLGGVCLVAATLDPDGRIVQLAGGQELAYGERDGARTPRVRALDAAMQGAGFDARLSDTILQDMWEKRVMLAAAGGLVCLLRGAVG